MIDTGQILVNSLVTSSLYLLAGTGLTLTYGLSRFPNFAYAEFITVGAYCGLIFLAKPEGFFLLALILGFLVAAVVSASAYSLIFRPLVERQTSLIHLMVASIALGYVIRHSIGEGWGWATKAYQLMWPVYNIGHVRITLLWIILIATAVLTAVVLHFVLTRTRTGKAIRAIASNPDLASITGINKQRVILLTWFFGAGLAAMAGIFRAADTRLSPMLGWDILLPIFAITLLGGIGSFYGLIIAALILGLAENFGVVFLSGVGLSTEYRMTIAFLILIGVLIVRPKGLAR